MGDGEFANKVVVVTGGASGIGRSILVAFAERGAKCMMGDINGEWGERIAAEMRGDGREVRFVKTDITNSGEVTRLFEETVKAYGGVDVVVNAIGIRVHYDVLEMAEEAWDAQIRVQLTGPFLVCREGARRMVKQGRGGSLINIGSTAAAVAHTGSSAHCASKAGLVQFTKVLAMELGQYGITANVVAPGLTRVVWPARKEPLGEEYVANALREIPLRRLGGPEEMAAAVVFMASEEARFITGQALYVDGGHSAGKMGIRGDNPSWVPAT